MGLVQTIIDLEDKCKQQIYTITEVFGENEEEKARYECELSMMRKIEPLLHKHFTNYSGQFEFLKGNETKGMHYRLTELLNEYCAKRKKDGIIKINRKGEVKYKTYRLFGIPNKDFFEKYSLLYKESEDTSSSCLSEITQKSLQGEKVLNGLFMITPIINLFTIPAILLYDKQEWLNHKLLAKAEVIDDQLENVVKPYLTEQLSAGNYRQPALVVEN